MQVARSAVSHPIQRGRVPGPEENHFPAGSPHMTPSVFFFFFFWLFRGRGCWKELVFLVLWWWLRRKLSYRQGTPLREK